MTHNDVLSFLNSSVSLSVSETIDKLFTKGLERSILHCDQTINDHIDSDKSAQKDDGLVLNRSSYISDHKSITKQTTS